MTKELFDPESPFPVAITAYDAARVGVGNKCKWRFGLDIARAIKRLRELADKLESKEHLLQGFSVESVADVQDFTMTTVKITFAEKYDLPAESE